MSSDNGHSELGHILPFKVYLNVLIALVVLTIITVGVSAKANFVEFGSWSIVIAMVVASIKAMIVALFFMHLKYENPVTWLYAVFPLFLLALLIGLVFIDNPFRMQVEKGTFVEKIVAAEKKPEKLLNTHKH